MNEVLDELTRWGQMGYAVALRHGHAFPSRTPYFGWTCTIQVEQIGSVYQMNLPVAEGAHETDPVAACRDALRSAGERWPEMVEKCMTPEQIAEMLVEKHWWYSHDRQGFIAEIAQAIRDAYERAAQVVDTMTSDYDGQALAVLDCAAHAIRKLKEQA